MKVVDAIRAGNNDVGGRLVEFSGTEYMVRGRGYAKGKDDLENIVVEGTRTGRRFWSKTSPGGDRAGNAARAGGPGREGDTVGGIVVMRYGENALNVIDRVKAKLDEVKPSLCPKALRW
jgi:Cu(I)/Ag(I) efflux system membrane protein CusA/SilA